MPRLLVACEYSGRVRDAFAIKGWEAWSCDLLPSERERGNHYQGPVEDLLDQQWDLMIAHPPCTHLAVSGALFRLALLALPSGSLGHDQYILQGLLRASPTPRGDTEADGFW